MKRALPLLMLTVWLVALPSSASAEQAVLFDRWYALLLQDQRAGWSHVRVTQDGDVIRSDSDMRISVRRGAMAIAMQVTTSFEETAAGEPVSSSVEQRIGSTQAMRQTMRFTEAGIEWTTEQGGQKQVRMHPRPEGPWLTPAASTRYAEARFGAGEKVVRFTTMDASMGPQPVETVMTLVGEEAVEVMGKVVPAKVIDATVSLLPGVVTRQYVDGQLQPVKLTVSLMPGMELTMVEADEALAKAKLNPPEMLVRTLVKPDRAITRPRALRRAVFTVGATEGELPSIQSTGVQRVEPVPDDRQVRVEINLDEPIATPEPDRPGPEHLRASPVLNRDDPEVQRLTVEVVGKLAPDASAGQRAEALRAFVQGYVKAKDLSVGFATASEVARTRQGDCTEHAVLLAAMLRAADIPSRTVTGLIYIDEFLGEKGVFGYHMWTQAWLDDRWVDLDATLPGGRAYDAAHIALGVSAMSEPALVNDLVRLMPTLGRLRINVIEADTAAAP